MYSIIINKVKHNKGIQRIILSGYDLPNTLSTFETAITNTTKACIL